DAARRPLRRPGEPGLLRPRRHAAAQGLPPLAAQVQPHQLGLHAEPLPSHPQDHAAALRRGLRRAHRDARDGVGRRGGDPGRLGRRVRQDREDPPSQRLPDALRPSLADQREGRAARVPGAVHRSGGHDRAGHRSPPRLQDDQGRRLPEPAQDPVAARRARPARGAGGLRGDPRPRAGPARTGPRDRRPNGERVPLTRFLRLLLLFVPISLWLGYTHASPTVVFVTACLAILPLAGLMGEATEHLTHHTGPGVGGLLNASFGNAAELIIAFMALRAGELEIVKASLTGSIIGNLLMVLGLAMLLGGWKHKELRFNRLAAESGSSMMILAVVALVIPAIYAQVTHHR